MTALHRICPEMAVALQQENRYRRSPELLDFTEDASWRRMLVDLAEMVPADALRGSDRILHSLEYEDIGVPRGTLLFPARAQQSSFLLTPSWQKGIDEDVLHILETFEIGNPEGGVCLAGGAALDIMMSMPVNDYDMFVIAPNEASAQKLLEGIMFLIGSTHVYKSKHAVTIKTKRGTTIQIILRIMANPAMAVMGFDIQASKVVMFCERGIVKSYATTSAVVAMRHMTIFVDPATQSASYAHRLYKYARRKCFDVSVPLLDRRVVNMGAIMSKDATGLAQLLRFTLHYANHEKTSKEVVDYDTGLQIRYAMCQRINAQASFLVRMMRALRCGATTIPKVQWVQTSHAMSQTMFTNAFHPCELDFYGETYSIPVTRIADLFDD